MGHAMNSFVVIAHALSSNNYDKEKLPFPKRTRAIIPEDNGPLTRSGADYKIRTCDLNLGKVALYQLS